MAVRFWRRGRQQVRSGWHEHDEDDNRIEELRWVAGDDTSRKRTTRQTMFHSLVAMHGHNC
jgi:hypothetical protein